MSIYKDIFYKDAKPFLLELLIIWIGLIADCEPDGDFRFVGRHASSNPDSGIVWCPFRGFRRLQKCSRSFRYREHNRETSFNLGCVRPLPKISVPNDSVPVRATCFARES